MGPSCRIKLPCVAKCGCATELVLVPALGRDGMAELAMASWSRDRSVDVQRRAKALLVDDDGVVDDGSPRVTGEMEDFSVLLIG